MGFLCGGCLLHYKCVQISNIEIILLFLTLVGFTGGDSLINLFKNISMCHLVLHANFSFLFLFL